MGSCIFLESERFQDPPLTVQNVGESEQNNLEVYILVPFIRIPKMLVSIIKNEEQAVSLGIHQINICICVLAHTKKYRLLGQAGLRSYQKHFFFLLFPVHDGEIYYKSHLINSQTILSEQSGLVVKDPVGIHKKNVENTKINYIKRSW